MTTTTAILDDIRLFVFIALNEAKRYTFYPIEFVSAFVNRAVTILILALFWIVAAEFSEGSNLDQQFLVAYYLVLAGLLQISFSNLSVSNMILKDIKSGRINSDLLRPIDTFRLEFARVTGIQIQFLVVSIALTVAGVVYAYEGINVPIAIWSVINMLGINYGLNRVVSCIGYYVVEAAGIKNAILHLLRLLQGMLIPLSLFPVLAQDILALTPFPHSLYTPVAVLLGKDFPVWQMLISSLWAVVILYGSKRLWAHSLKRYEAIGI